MDTNPYKTCFNFRTRMFEIRDNIPDGSVRWSCTFDEGKPIISQMQAALRQAEFIMTHPLMNIDQLNEVVAQAKKIPVFPEKALSGSTQSVHPAHIMVSWYQNMLWFLSTSRDAIAWYMQAIKDGVDPLKAFEISGLRDTFENIGALLDVHEQNIPESGPARDPLTLTDQATKTPG